MNSRGLNLILHLTMKTIWYYPVLLLIAPTVSIIHTTLSCSISAILVWSNPPFYGTDRNLSLFFFSTYSSCVILTTSVYLRSKNTCKSNICNCSQIYQAVDECQLVEGQEWCFQKPDGHNLPTNERLQLVNIRKPVHEMSCKLFD